MRGTNNHGGVATLAIAAIAAVIVAVIATGSIVAAQSASGPASDPATGASRLVSVQHLASPDGELCAWQPSPADTDSDLTTFGAEEQRAALGQGRPAAFLRASLEQGNLLDALLQGDLLAALRQGGPVSAAAGARSERALTPVRTIRDTHPTYSAIAVDVNSNEVILQDNNLWSYRVFNRLDHTPPGVELTPPKRVVMGPDTALQFNNGLYVDPKNGDIYSVESDTGDKMVVFPRDANGNVKPKRILNTAHRVYNIAVDEEQQELFITVEFPPEIVVYRKEAGGDEKPLRRIQGEHTGLEAPHGIAVDSKNRLLYVNSWGHYANFRVPGTGRFSPPSIKVYALDASGDAPPVRVITGDRTQLNWPAAMKLNPDNGELYVANDIGQSVLVFRGVATAQGNVAPVRVVRGSKTRLRNPTGLFLDTKNQELWVSNLGNASATAYPLMANGDVAPLRVIRSAPEGKRSLNFGRTAAVAYDSTREQLLIPN